MRLFFIILIFIAAPLFYSSVESISDNDQRDTKGIIKVIADSIIGQATFKFVDPRTGGRLISPEAAPPGSQIQIESRYNDWRYWNGVINIAMLRMGKVLNNQNFNNYALKNIAFNFDHYEYFKEKHNGQDKWSYPFAQHFIMEELDDYGAMGASLIEIFKIDPQERYKTYIDKAAYYISNRQFRLEDGTFIRSFPQRYTLWADDLYMSISFLSRLGEMTGDMKYFNDAAKQVINFHKYLFDKNKKLYHHNWYSENKKQGVAFWGRANGWAMLAQADLLDRLPADHPLRDTLLSLFREHVHGISIYQSSEGLWHQLLDRPDSYLETSCSAMFAYSIARGVNKGYLKSSFSSIAKKAWEGVKSKISPDGKIEGVCTGTVVSDDLNSYYNRPAPLNDIHGIGAVLLAGTEILELQNH